MYHLYSYHVCRICPFRGNEKEMEKHKNHHCSDRREDQLGRGQFTVKDKIISPFKIKQGFDGEARVYTHSGCRFNFIEEYFENYKSIIEKILLIAMSELGSIKVQGHSQVVYAKNITFDSVEYIDSPVHSILQLFVHPREIKENSSKMIASIIHNNQVFQKYGSGLILDQVTGFELSVGYYQPRAIGSHIPTPANIAKKRATININKNGHECFKWSVISSLHRIKSNSSKVSSYKKFESLYDFDCIEFPVKISNIKKFEKKNNLTCNIFSYKKLGNDNFDILPEHISDFNYKSTNRTVNLLLLQKGGGEVNHFIAITDINRLLGKKNNHRHVLCYFCMCFFTSQDKLSVHHEECRKHGFQKVTYPVLDPETGEKPVTQFKNHHKK